MKEMYNNEIEIYKKQVIDKLHILIGAMILDGYDEYDSCVKYVNELIKELENEWLKYRLRIINGTYLQVPFFVSIFAS